MEGVLAGMDQPADEVFFIEGRPWAGAAGTLKKKGSQAGARLFLTFKSQRTFPKMRSHPRVEVSG